jgi:hypothetical protein
LYAWCAPARDARIHRVRNAVEVFPTGEPPAQLVGALLGRAGGTSTVDALVAAEAILAGADVLRAGVSGPLPPAGSPRA